MFFAKFSCCDLLADIFSIRVQSEIQADDELNVCNFVDSLMENNYDETGEIWLKSASFDIANWQSLQEYQKEVSRMTPVQMFFLIASLFLMLGLFIYAVYLYSKIRTYLGSKNRYPTYRSYTIDRDQSGITENRSDNFGAYAWVQERAAGWAAASPPVY